MQDIPNIAPGRGHGEYGRMSDPLQHFGSVFRERRLEKGFSLRKFAELVDISPTYFSLVETGKAAYAPAAERVRNMAEVLGTDLVHWIVLTGRVPEDVKNIILKDLVAMPALLRAVNNLTPEQLKKLITDAERKGEGARTDGRQFAPEAPREVPVR